MRPTWRDRKTMGANGTTNSLLKQAIVNRMKPLITSEDNRSQAAHLLTSNFIKDSMDRNDAQDKRMSVTKEKNKLPNGSDEKGDVITAFAKRNDQEVICFEKNLSNSKNIKEEINSSEDSSQSSHSSREFSSDEMKTAARCEKESSHSEISQDAEENNMLLCSSDDEKCPNLCGVKRDTTIEASQPMSKEMDTITTVSSPNSEGKANYRTKEKSTVMEPTKHSVHKEPLNTQLIEKEMPRSSTNSQLQSPKDQLSRRHSFMQDKVTIIEVPGALALSNDAEIQSFLRHKAMGKDKSGHASIINETLHSPFGSQKSVTFNDKVELHEIARIETSSSEEEITVESDEEMSKPSIETHHHLAHFLENLKAGTEHSSLYDMEGDNTSTIASGFEQPLHSYLAQDLSDNDDEESFDNHSPTFPVLHTRKESKETSYTEAQPFINNVEQGADSAPPGKGAIVLRSTGVQTTAFFPPDLTQTVDRNTQSENGQYEMLPRSIISHSEGSSHQRSVKSNSLYTTKDAISFVTTIKSRKNNTAEISSEDDFLIDAVKQSGHFSRSESFENLLPESKKTPTTYPTSLHRTITRNEIEDQMKNEFLARFGAGRRAPFAQDDAHDPVYTMGSLNSIFSTDSQESVVSEASIRKESATHRNFNY
ncbi:PHB [Parelaphostrongylus tenuis]|uniref:PHB n=1 Tax=Parelaphostrongylus tenuis TaxID=148309 RepID=A0AAD5R980_PARTN|nr:PHB [Parelaphostrongylus tenuis]